MTAVKRREKRRLLFQAFRTVGADKVFIVYFFWFLVAAFLICLVEPHIKNYGDGLWFCFASASTIGYGDIAATTPIGRTITIVLSVYSVAVVAIFTAVIVSYFTDMVKARADASMQKFTYDLQHLTELSKEELEDLSNRVKDFLDKKKK